MFGRLCGPELYSNLVKYGAITPMVEAMQNRRDGLTAVDLFHTAQGIDWWTKLSGIWLYDNLCKAGWSFFDAGPKPIVRYHRLTVVCLMGWVCLAFPWIRLKSPVFRSRTAPVACLVLCLSYTAALSYHMVQSKLARGVSMTNTWYAAATLPWFLVLVAGGALCWPLKRLRPILPAMPCDDFPRRRVHDDLGPTGPDLLGRRRRLGSPEASGQLSAGRFRNAHAPSGPGQPVRRPRARRRPLDSIRETAVRKQGRRRAFGHAPTGLFETITTERRVIDSARSCLVS